MKMMMMMMVLSARANMFVSILKLFIIALMTSKTVIAASSVIPVNVTMDNNTCYPHQYMNVNITFNNFTSDTTSDSSEDENLYYYLTFIFVHANTTKRDILTDRNKVLDVTVEQYDTMSLVVETGQYVVRNPIIVRGFYKLFVSITSATYGNYNSSFALAGIQVTSKAYRVLPLLLRMETIPNRRRFIQGEVLDPMTFINDPYFEYMYSSNNNGNPNEYYAYSGYIVPRNYPNKTLYNTTITGRPDILGYTSISLGCGNYCEIFRVLLPAGAYKIGLFKRTDLYSESYAYVTSIPNSTFTIVQNNFTISLNKNTYKKGDTIIASLTSIKLLSSSFYHNREPIFFSISNREYGGTYYQWGKFYPDDTTNQKLISNSIVIDWDEIGTFAVSTIDGTSTTIVKEFTITK